MGYFVFLTFSLLIIVAGVVIGNWAFKNQTASIAAKTQAGYRTQNMAPPGVFRWSGLAVAGIMAVLLIGVTGYRTVHTVENGHIGIVKQFGSIVGTTGEGLVFTAPWQSLDPVSVKTERITYRMTGNPEGDSIGSAVSKDSQAINIVAILNYQVQRSGVVDLYRKTGGDYVHRIIDPAVPQEIKATTAGYKAIEFAANREAIRIKAQEALGEALRNDSIIVNNISFANVGFTPEFDKAIEETQVAEQNAKREEAKIRVSTAQAAQKVAEANGTAQSILVEAKAQAQANRLINNSLTDRVVQYEAVKRITPGVNTILLPSDSNFILPQSLVTKKAPNTVNK